MSNLYLIRNLLSLKAAKSIDEQYFYHGSVFSVIDTDYQLKNIILNNLEETKINVVSTVKFPVYGAGFNILKQRQYIKEAKDEVEKLLSHLSTTQLFITYPMHFDSYVYYIIAKKLRIKVCFYEEGPCFYRAGLTKQYDINTKKDALRRLYFELCGLKRGYSFNADNWYCSLPIKEKHRLIRLKYKKVNLPSDVKRVFLSRPVSDDYPEIKITDEVNAIKKFYDFECDGEILYLKFHPRESETKRDLINDGLLKLGIQIAIIEGDMPSEDVIFSMEAGAVCGYDTTTLVYANNINNNVKVYSVLNSITGKDHSGFLTECYQEYKLKYNHIYMIE
ncbi:polysialyltransferase family glycosyltransferase [Vibrio cyclitrophicus]|uniref:polysialyltransferase family glycosyltransferase n=1 Tax=Vibrio cyclitrophicus TaxID=47951 RepID=UPI000C82757C|nr:polysialyltransferase family glycosyltransferase [Vibrio cyclitrophicus]PMJ53050.1 hypothetical protein BCU19_20970 [Vibrio cyclitrophicus]